MKKVDKDAIKKQLATSYRVFQLAWQARPTAVLGYLLGAVLEITGSIASIYATAKLGALLANFAFTGQTAGIWFWLWIDVAALIATGIGFWVMSYATRLMYFSVVRLIVNRFLGNMCQVDLQDFYDNDFRNQINKVGGSYIWQLPNLAHACLELTYGMARFIAITVVVAQITWWLIPLIIVFLIPSLIGEGRLAKTQWFVWDSKGDWRHIFWGLDYIVKQAKGQMELRSTQAAPFVLGKIDDMNREFYSEQEKKFRHASRALFPTKILEVFGTAIGSIVLLLQFLARDITLDRYLFLSGALLRIGGALNAVFGTITRMQEGLPLASSYFDVIDRKPTIIDPQDGTLLPSEAAPKIEFENVTFTYPGQEQPVFENLNLTIQAGEHVAFVGENGAGKSTFIKLLLRFYQPDSGQILINGRDLSKVQIESWYAQLATLFQDFNQYPLSIAENIEIGRSSEKADKKRLEQAGKFGSVDELVKDYKHGWDTVLDASFKKGIEPSGGQWQRVALARAFYRNANMIILDEPTSAIDAKAEYDIFNNIFDHYKDKTALIVSHRFSTVRRADKIVVVDHGKIVEQGSHKELIKQKGLYHDLFTKQAEGYKD